jgi:hypothetical protein
VKRLFELDLQYRGALALSEAKRAVELEVTPEQAQKVTLYMEEYRTRQNALMAEATGNGDGVARPNGPLAMAMASPARTAP